MDFVVFAAAITGILQLVAVAATQIYNQNHQVFMNSLFIFVSIILPVVYAVCL